MQIKVADQKPHTIKDILSRHTPDYKVLADIYKNFHQYPELSHQESKTAAWIAKYLKQDLKLDEVYEHIGDHGVVGLIRNGKGKTVLLRADMDALPVLEETGLDYASKVTMTDGSGKTVPVMHACGHDVHMTCLLGVTKMLMASRSEWSGTFICLFQPSEEAEGGAQGMVDGGLYRDYGIPLPDILLGQHVVPLPADVVAIAPGPIMAAADSYRIRLYGRGTHCAKPQNGIDPILLASSVIVRLHSIVGREVSPRETAVLSVGSVHGGSAANIIPEYVDIELTIRTYTPEVRKIINDAMKRVVQAECDASGVDRKPDIKLLESIDAIVNDEKSEQELESGFKAFFKQNQWRMEPDPGSEDFGILGTAINRPYVYWNFGCYDHEKWEDAKRRGRLAEEIPDNHSPKFAPLIDATLRTGVEALAFAALFFML